MYSNSSTTPGRVCPRSAKHFRVALCNLVCDWVGAKFEARMVLDARRRAEEDQACDLAPRRRGSPAHRYHARRGGHYDSVNRTPKLEPRPPGPRVFSRHIRSAPFPVRYRQPMTIVKYNRDTNPDLWLDD